MSYFKCSDVLEYANLKSTSSLAQASQFRLEKVTQQITEILNLQTRCRNIQLEVSYSDETLKQSYFIGQALAYQQVLFNILSNAVKFSKNNSKICISIENESLDRYKTLLSVEVQD